MTSKPLIGGAGCRYAGEEGPAPAPARVSAGARPLAVGSTGGPAGVAGSVPACSHGAGRERRISKATNSTSRIRLSTPIAIQSQFRLPGGATITTGKTFAVIA